MKKNQKYTRQQMFAHIENWRASKLSQKNYCKQEGLSPGTFHYWIKKHKEENRAGLFDNFIPVEVVSPKPDPVGDNISIHYPNGVYLECPSRIPVEKISSLIKL